MSHHQNFYFKGLNALRFFAAYLVVLHHGETIRHKFGLPNWAHLSLFQNGALAVSFFFVLSGFLITFLLLTEWERSATVSLKNFYMRRVLRIFPLYYLMIIIGLGLVPLFLNAIHYPNSQPYDSLTGAALFLFFLSFVVNALFGSHLLEPLWSIGVEEYFYLLWAPLFKYLRRYLVWLIVGLFGFKVLGLLWLEWQPPTSDVGKIVADVFATLKFELMAIGAGGAYVFYHYREGHGWQLLFSRIGQICLYVLLFLRLFMHNTLMAHHIHPYDWFFSSVATQIVFEGGLFLWLIFNTALNPKAIGAFRHRFWHVLGDISYGIYMYQMLIIFGVVLIIKRFLVQMSVATGAFVFYGLVTIGLLLVSFLSKKYFEDYFLRLKHKFL